MGSPKQTFMSDLALPKNPAKSRGKIIVRADAVASTNDEAHFRVSARLRSKATMCRGQDNPYLIISRARDNQAVSAHEKDFIRVFAGPNLPNVANPIWQPMIVKMQLLCNGNVDLPLKFAVHKF